MNGPCDLCGKPDNAGIGDTVWFADNDLWNAVMRGGSISGTPQWNDLVCATCFMVLAEEQGIASLFRVTAENARVFNVRLSDSLPSGIVLVSGSGRLDGDFVDDSFINGTLDLATVENGETVILTFRATARSFSSNQLTLTVNDLGNHLP